MFLKNVPYSSDVIMYWASQVVLVVETMGEAHAGNIRASGLVPGLGRSPGEGLGNPLQDSCLENPWTEEPGGQQSTGVTKSWT